MHEEGKTLSKNIVQDRTAFDVAQNTAMGISNDISFCRFDDFLNLRWLNRDQQGKFIVKIFALGMLNSRMIYGQNFAMYAPMQLQSLTPGK